MKENISSKYDLRIKQYENGLKQWDTNVSLDSN